LDIFKSINGAKLMQRQSLLGMFRGLWKHLDIRRRLQLFLVFILIIFAALLEVVSLGSVVPFLTAISSNNKYLIPSEVFDGVFSLFGWSMYEHQILLFSLLFGISAVLAGVARLLLLWAQTRLSFSVGADFSVMIYEKTLYQPYAIQISRNSNEIISGVTTKANCMVMNAIYPILTIVSSMLIMIGILGVLFKISPIVALASCIGFGGIYFFIVVFTRKQLVKDSLKISKESDEVLKTLSHGLGGIRDVLLDGTQPYFIQAYQNSELALRRALANTQLISSSPRFIVESLGMFLIATLSYVLTDGSAGVDHAVPILGALALGAQRLLPLLQQIYANWSAIRAGQHSVLDALNLLDQQMPLNLASNSSERIRFNESLEFKNVSFRYVNSSKWAIKDLSIKFPKGGCIGIIGATGGGKSTLADLIMALLHPEVGEMTVDGQRITQLNQRLWQSQVAHVPQNIFLSDATILENIAFGVPYDEIDQFRVENAAKMAQIHEVIASLEDGYLTRVGERGVKFSGGQRQRIAIARALYKRAEVIVFDEATSALDSQTESQVMTQIYRLRKNITIFIIAHRHSTLEGCTEIIEVNDGMVGRAINRGKFFDAPLNG
jgi:ATP-binding cassette, subfamily B, bacterial PglK